jgi:WD40 repeat protein
MSSSRNLRVRGEGGKKKKESAVFARANSFTSSSSAEPKTPTRGEDERGEDEEVSTPGGLGVGEASPVADVERPIWGMDTFAVSTKTAIRCLAVSADGKYLAVGSDDPRVFLFEWEGGPRVSTVGAVTMSLRTGGALTALSGKWVEKGALRIRDGHVALLAFSGRGELLVGSDASLSDIFMFEKDPERGWVAAPRTRMDGGSAEVRRLRGAVFNVSPFFGPGAAIVQRPDGMEWLATWARDKDESMRKVRLYMLEDSGRWVWRQSLEHGAEVHDVAFAPWGSALATAGADGVVRVWRLGDDSGRVGVGGRAGSWVEQGAFDMSDALSAGKALGEDHHRPDADADADADVDADGSPVTIPADDTPGSAGSAGGGGTPGGGGSGGTPGGGGGGAGSVRALSVTFSPHGEVMVVGVGGKGAPAPLRVFRLLEQESDAPLAAPSVVDGPAGPWRYAHFTDLHGPKGRMHALRFSPDAMWFMAASKDLRLWRVSGLSPAPGLGPQVAPGAPVLFEQGVKLAGFHGEGAPAIFVPPTGVWIAAGVSPTSIKFWRILEAERRVAMAQVAIDVMRIRIAQRYARGWLVRHRIRRQRIADKQRLEREAAQDRERVAAEEKEREERVAAEEKERAERAAAEEKARAERAAADEKERAERVAAEEKERAERAAAEEKERVERAAAEEKERAERAAAEEKERAERVAAEEKERAERAAAEEKERAERAAAEEKERAERAAAVEKERAERAAAEEKARREREAAEALKKRQEEADAKAKAAAGAIASEQVAVSIPAPAAPPAPAPAAKAGGCCTVA